MLNANDYYDLLFLFYYHNRNLDLNQFHHHIGETRLYKIKIKPKNYEKEKRGKEEDSWEKYQDTLGSFLIYMNAPLSFKFTKLPLCEKKYTL